MSVKIVNLLAMLSMTNYSTRSNGCFVLFLYIYGSNSSQTKDFWREAHILSKLHHPNIVAFYGVVPDGLGGTLATVTEYMANGSLRHVLLRKDR